MGKHPYSLFLLFSVFIFVCLFCFCFSRVVSPAPISHPGEPGDKSSSNPWPLIYQKWTTPRDKRLSYHLRSYYGMMTTPHDKEVTHRGVTLHSISTKGNEWVSEVEIECVNVQGFSCWMGFPDTIKSSISKELLCESIELCTVFTLYLQCLLCYADHKLYLVKLFVAR